MRENIGLFKAKDINTNEWVEGFYFNFNARVFLEDKPTTRLKHCIVLNDTAELYIEIEIDPETICQFTGLLDKHGNKIWENDVLDYWENGKENIKQRLKVFYENGQFVVNHYAINLLNSRNMSSKIIGNIFDNPELLTKE